MNNSHEDNAKPIGGSEDPQTDSANNKLGPTDKLREHDSSEAELSVPGAQNPNSEEIKGERSPNTE